MENKIKKQNFNKQQGAFCKKFCLKVGEALLPRASPSLKAQGSKGQLAAQKGLLFILDPITIRSKPFFLVAQKNVWGQTGKKKYIKVLLFVIKYKKKDFFFYLLDAIKIREKPLVAQKNFKLVDNYFFVLKNTKKMMLPKIKPSQVFPKPEILYCGQSSTKVPQLTCLISKKLLG
jgi:hypothetical protein